MFTTQNHMSIQTTSLGNLHDVMVIDRSYKPYRMLEQTSPYYFYVV